MGMFSNPHAPRCIYCRTREATTGRTCEWCAPCATGDLEELRGRVYRHFSPRSARDVSDLLRWMVTLLPTDAEMVQILAGRVSTASWCAGAAANALKACSDALLKFAGFVGDGK